MEAIDLGALYFFSTHHVEALTTINLAITSLGNFSVMAPVAAMMALLLWCLRGGRTAGLFAVAVVLTYLLCLGTQLGVDRARPDVREKVLPTPAVGSFPSGHATNSLVIYGLFSLLATRPWRSIRARRIVCATFFLAAFLIGVTRLYLAVHFVSDVVGGWLLALGVLLLVMGLDRLEEASPSTKESSP